MPTSVQVVERRAQAHGVGDVAGAGLEARRRWLVDGLLEGDIHDHVAAALPRRGVVEHVGLAVDHADAGGGKTLWPGEDEEVAIERLHVLAHVGDRLRAVDQHARAVAMSHLHHLARRGDGAQRVGHLGKRHDPRARTEQLFVLLQNHLAAIVHRRDAQARALLRGTVAARARCWRGAPAR